MEFLAQLWLPIVLAAVAVFFASFLTWAVLPFHHGDYKKLPDEGGVISMVKSAGMAAGNYAFPYCDSHAQKKDPEFQKKWAEGPAGIVTVFPKFNMGRNMGLTFLVFLAVSVLIAYLAWVALRPGASFAEVFQVVGTAGVLAYCFSFLPNGIWFGQSGRAMALSVIDGIAYGLITGLVFALMWPSSPGL